MSCMEASSHITSPSLVEPQPQPAWHFPHQLTWCKKSLIRVTIKWKSYHGNVDSDSELDEVRSGSNFTPDYVQFLTKFLSANLLRIQRLSRRRLPNNIMHKLALCLNKIPVLLEEAVFHIDNRWSGRNVQIFGGSAPRLDRLLVDGGCMTWAPLSCPKITRLHVYCGPGSPTVSETLSALANMPLLQELFICEKCFPTCPAGYSGGTPDLTLSVSWRAFAICALPGPLMAVPTS